MAWFERPLTQLGEPVGLNAETLARRTTGASFRSFRISRTTSSVGVSMRLLVAQAARARVASAFARLAAAADTAAQPPLDPLSTIRVLVPVTFPLRRMRSMTCLR